MAQVAFVSPRNIPLRISVGAGAKRTDEGCPMSYPHRPLNHATGLREPRRPWTVTPNGRPLRALPPTRRYEVTWRNAVGEVLEATRVAPAIPAFEAAFSALARGALIATPRGEVAVEDLLPGMMVNTRSGPQPVRWIGRMLLPPANLKQDSGPDIFRVTADAFGAMRPAPDLVLCSGARILHRSSRLATSRIGPDVLVPVADFADGIHLMQIAPMSPVTAYHLALDRHAAIEVNGLALESFHPGRNGTEGLSGDMLRLFMSLFPYLQDACDFGPLALPRLGLDDLDRLAASA
jgi:hypothetical protein